MANYFANLFQRKQSTTYLNLLQDGVPQVHDFKKRSTKELQDLYLSLVEVRIIEDFISDAIVKIPVGVYRDDEEVFGTPLNLLIERSNPEQTWSELIKEMFIFYGTTGNGYLLYHEGYLYALEAADITIQLGLSKSVPEFLNFVSGYSLLYEGRPYPLEFSTVFHFKTAGIKSAQGQWVYGSSPYESAIPNIDSLEANYSSRVGIIKNRGALGFITNRSALPDPEETQRAQQALSTFGLMQDRDKLLVSTQDLRYQQMQLGIQELELINNLQIDFTKLCNLKGIDPIIFASEGATYANQDSAYRGTVRKALIPTAEHFYTKFNEWIRPISGGLKVLPKVDEVPEYNDLGLEQSQKIISELSAGILDRTQALEMLYPDLEITITDQGISAERDPDADDQNTQAVGVDQNVQQTVLNGAQVSSMVQVVTAVANGEIPHQSGVGILMASYGFTEAEANKVLGK